MSPPKDGERGSVSIAVVGLTAVVAVLLLGLADLTGFLLARAKAQTAADAAALAAAGELVPGARGQPSREARRFAQANGGEMIACDCRPGTREAIVRVSVPVHFQVLRVLGIDAVQSRARAEVDLTNLGRMRR